MSNKTNAPTQQNNVETFRGQPLAPRHLWKVSHSAYGRGGSSMWDCGDVPEKDKEILVDCLFKNWTYKDVNQETGEVFDEEIIADILDGCDYYPWIWRVNFDADGMKAHPLLRNLECVQSYYQTEDSGIILELYCDEEEMIEWEEGTVEGVEFLKEIDFLKAVNDEI